MFNYSINPSQKWENHYIKKPITAATSNTKAIYSQNNWHIQSMLLKPKNERLQQSKRIQLLTHKSHIHQIPRNKHTWCKTGGVIKFAVNSMIPERIPSSNSLLRNINKCTKLQGRDSKFLSKNLIFLFSFYANNKLKKQSTRKMLEFVVLIN